MKYQSPFLDIKSFVTEEVVQDVLETSSPPSSPFLLLYEFGDAGHLVDPEAEKYTTFLNELYDEEFDEALSNLVNEAKTIVESQFMHEKEDPQTTAYQAERLLDQHYAPLVAEADSMLDALAAEFRQRNPDTLTDDEIETIFERYQPSSNLSPASEEFFGKLKKAFKKVTKFAKKGIKAVATGGISLILPKLKALVPQLVKRVIRFAIGRLPASLRPIAKKLARRLPLLKEMEQADGSLLETAPIYDVTEIQYEFNQEVGEILCASTEVEQDLEVAKVLTEQQAPDTYPLAELDRARDLFIDNLQQLKEGEDHTIDVENFVPAILPALRLGIRLIGRKRVVRFLAKFIARLIKRFVGPQYATPLSKAIVDTGLRLLQLEVTPEEASEAAASAVAATVEGTVRRVAAAPEHILDSQELLEGFVLEAFEEEAAANFPAMLSKDTYRLRPELDEARKLGGIWMMMPIGRSKRHRYKKFSRKIPIRVSPHKVSAVETFEGISLGEVLQEQFGIAPGEEMEALVHLYEATPDTQQLGIIQHDEKIAAARADGYQPLNPLSREAAVSLLGDAEIGREIDSQRSLNGHSALPGQRFYYLEIPGRRPLTTPLPSGRTRVRRPTRLRLILDFPSNEIRVYLFLSEIRAQEIAVKLRQHTHIGTVVGRLRMFVDRGIRGALKGAYGRLKIVHEAVTPDQWINALQRLPSFVPQVLMGRLQEWILKGLLDNLKQHGDEFVKAAEDAADGVTLMINLKNPPGLPQLRQALNGKALSPSSLKLADGAPTVKTKVGPGYIHE